jgi:hypothetical protein
MPNVRHRAPNRSMCFDGASRMPLYGSHFFDPPAKTRIREGEDSHAWGEHAGGFERRSVMSGGTTAARYVPWVMCTALVLMTNVAGAEAPVRQVAIGSVHVAKDHPRARSVFRHSLEQALASTEGVRLVPRHASDLLVRASLGDVERQGDLVRYRVSLFVEDRRSGALRMMLRGSASARGPKAHRAALDGAVRSALRRLGPPPPS